MLSLMLAAAVGGEMAVERAELKAATTAIQKLTAAAGVPVIRTEDAKTRGEIEAAAVHGSRRAELEAIVRFIEKFHPLIGREMTATEVFNYHQVVRDLVNTGLHLAVLPEEQLCWERAGLNLSLAHRRVLKRQVGAGVMPSQALDQAIAQVARFETRYRDALARCVAPAN